MIRHIKIKAEIVPPDMNKIKVQIIDQTHRRFSFVPEGDTFINKYCVLTSAGGPEFVPHQYVDRSGKKSSCYMFVRGGHTPADNGLCTVNLEEFNLLKQAVELYNETYK